MDIKEASSGGVAGLAAKSEVGRKGNKRPMKDGGSYFDKGKESTLLREKRGSMRERISEGEI